MMKILHVANEVVDTGNGISNAAVDLACCQSEMGHSVSFISSGGGYVKLLSDYHVRHFELCQLPRKISKLMSDMPKLKAVVDAERPEIVHAHMMLGAVIMRLGRPLFNTGGFGLVTTVHNEWRMASQLMSVGDRVIVLSESGRRRYARRGFPHSKMRVVKHGVVNAPRLRIKITGEGCHHVGIANPTIVTVAGLYRRKGIGELLEAFGQIAGDFPTASLVIIGWGPDRESLDEQRKKIAGGDRVNFTGFIASPQAILRRASIFALPSHTESFPLALAEARAAGCAVVGTTVGGIPELLEEGRAGLLVPPHDPAALAAAFRRLLGDDDELTRWRQAATANLEWLRCERMTRDTLEVYSELLAERRGLGKGRA